MSSVQERRGLELSKHWKKVLRLGATVSSLESGNSRPLTVQGVWVLS